MDGRSKAFIILTPGFAASENDSACLPLHQNFVRALATLHPQIKICVLSFHYPFRKDIYDFSGATVYSFNGRNRKGITKFLLRKKAFRSLEEIYRANEVIGILSFWVGECALVGKHFAQRYGLKHHSWILGQDAKKGNRYPSRIEAESADLIALSDFLQDTFEKNHGVRPLKVICAGVNGAAASGKHRNIDLLAAGSLIVLKQFDIFLEVVRNIKQEMPLVKAVLIGDGPEKKKMQKLVQNFSLQDNVHFTGELPNDKVLDLMTQSKLFLHPSSYEGFSGVCLEALSAGMNVISFIKPMQTAIKNWHIVNNKAEMTKLTSALLKDPSLLFEPVIFQTMEQVAENMMNLYLR